jgi:hypothetical protein
MTAPKARSQAPAKARQGSNKKTINLRATLIGGRVEINGAGGVELPKKSGEHNFEFLLDDQTGLNVRFKQVHDGMLDVQDNSRDCPPPCGMNTDQIIDVKRTSDLRAGFKNKNDNKSPMPISYQLNFECDDPSKHPIQYDPIIINGGK